MLSSRSPRTTGFTVLLDFYIFVAIATACSYSTFASIYDPYPVCARLCLACRDADYVNDFANNCNYSDGDCCLSKFQVVILDTWACVLEDCDRVDAQDAQTAFNTYVNYCSDLGFPLAQADVPLGIRCQTHTLVSVVPFLYQPSSGLRKPMSLMIDIPGSGNFSSPSLSKADIAGIIVGSIGGALTGISVYVAILQYRRRHQRANNEEALTVRGGGAGAAWVVMRRGAAADQLFNGPHGADVTYKKTTSVF